MKFLITPIFIAFTVLISQSTIVMGQADDSKAASKESASAVQPQETDSGTATSKKQNPKEEEQKIKALAKRMQKMFKSGQIAELEKHMTENSKREFAVDTLMLLSEFTFDDEDFNDEDFDDEELDEYEGDADDAENQEFSSAELAIVDELIDISEEHDLGKLDPLYPETVQTKTEMKEYDQKLMGLFGDSAKRAKLLSQIAPKLHQLLPEEYYIFYGVISDVKFKEGHASVTFNLELQEFEKDLDGIHADGVVEEGVEIFRFVKAKNGWQLDGFDDEAHDRLAERANKALLTNVRLTGSTYRDEKVDLESFKGKVVLVDFWGTWCAPCVAELPKLKKIHTALKSHGFEIVGVANDDKASLKQFFGKQPLPWPSIVDADGDIASAFGVAAFPTLLLFDKEGNNVARDLHGIKLANEIIKRLELDKKDFKELRSSLKSPNNSKESQAPSTQETDSEETGSGETGSVEHGQELTKLVKEFEQAKELWDKEVKAAETKKQKKAAKAKDPSKMYGTKFLEFAKNCEHAADYVPALDKAMSHGDTSVQFASARLLVDVLTKAENKNQVKQAREVLGSDSTKEFLEMFSYMLPSAEREALGKDLIRVSNGNTKGLALNALADIYKRKMAMASYATRMSGGETAEEKKSFREYWSKDTTPAEFKKLETMLGEFLRESDNTSSGNSTIKQCKRRLFSLQHLIVGKPAPEIVGKDLSGVEFKLSDYRGKVVLLDFWAHW